jgi:hypothetical protein
MSSIDPNDMTRSSSSKEDGLAQLSKDIIHQNKNQSIFFFYRSISRECQEN